MIGIQNKIANSVEKVCFFRNGMIKIETRGKTSSEIAIILHLIIKNFILGRKSNKNKSIQTQLFDNFK
jgi:hypothetical protein